MKNSDGKDKKKALGISIKEGSAASFSAGIANSYITPFALALKAQPIHIGILSSLIGILSPLSQFFGSKLIGKFHRKKIVLAFVLLQALTWIPIATIGFLYWKGILTNYLLYILIILYSVIAIFGGIHYPAWFSWMGDLVKENERGKYFAKRNLATGIIEISAVLVGLAILGPLENKSYVFVGFGILFILAFFFRLISYSLLQQQYSPSRFKLNGELKVSTKDLLKDNKNFGKFSVYQAIFNFAIMIASPFFAVYMLKELNFSYYVYIAVILSSSIFYLMFLPLAGKFSDKYGNLKLMYISNFLFVLSPILWLFFKTPMYIIIFPQIVSGIANAAYVIAFTNFTYSTVKPKYLGLGVAYINILAGIGIFIGSISGGILLKYINLLNLNINSYFILFITAAAFRLLSALYFIPTIKEEKKIKRIPHVHISITHPFKTFQAEIGWFKRVFK